MSQAGEIVNKVGELEKLVEEIKQQEAIISSESGSDQASQDRIAAARSVISTKESEFNAKCSEATSKLSALKSMDQTLSFVNEFAPSDNYLEKLAQLGYGTFEKKTFTASNGTSVSYYVYVPDYGEEVEGLPVHLYLHGSSESGSGVLDVGLPNMLKNETITPSGIVICAQAPDASAFYNSNYQQALVELTNNVADTYDADKNKISLSGHSYGAIVGYQLVSNYPDEFAAFIPISGNSAASQGAANTKIWAFHGSEDLGGGSTDYDTTKKLVSEINNMGGDATLHTFEGDGHSGVQKKTFEQEYEYKDGEMYNPLEWAFQQSRAV